MDADMKEHPDYAEGYARALAFSWHGEDEVTEPERTNEFVAGWEAGEAFCKALISAGFEQVAKGQWTLSLK